LHVEFCTGESGAAGHIQGVFDCKGCSFSDNKATKQGGAFYARGSGAVLNFNETVFTSNTAVGEGGSIYVDRVSMASATVKQSEFRSNKAHAGGALFISLPDLSTQEIGSAILDFSDNLFIDNQGVTDTFKSSAASGGAIHVKEPVRDKSSPACSFPRAVNLLGCEFQSNQAPFGGALFWEVNGNQGCELSTMCANCNFTKNVATGYGNDVASLPASSQLIGLLPTPLPGIDNSYVFKLLDMFGQPVSGDSSGDHAEIAVFLSVPTEESLRMKCDGSDAMTTVCTTRAVGGRANFKSIKFVNATESTAFSMAILTQPGTDFDATLNLSTALASCPSDAVFTLALGCTFRRHAESVRLITERITSKLTKGSEHASSTHNLTVKIGGTMNENLLWSILTSGLPHYIETLQTTGSVPSTASELIIPITLKAAGLMEGSHDTSVIINVKPEGESNPSLAQIFTVPVALQVDAPTVASTSVWGRKSPEGVLKAADTSNLALNMKRVLYFTACDVDGFPVAQSVPKADDGRAFSVSVKSPYSLGASLHPHASSPTFVGIGQYEVELTLKAAGSYTIALHLGATDVASELTIHAVCPSDFPMTSNNSATGCGCEPGKAELGRQCVSCAAGTYTNVAGATQCLPCPAGFAQPLDGSHSCVGCVSASHLNLTYPVPIPCLSGRIEAFTRALCCIAAFWNLPAKSWCNGVPQVWRVGRFREGVDTVLYLQCGLRAALGVVSSCRVHRLHSGDGHQLSREYHH
jgi:predicted outer membrane repeat protein